MRRASALLASLGLGGLLAACATLLGLDDVQYRGGADGSANPPADGSDALDGGADSPSDASTGGTLLWHVQLTAGDAGSITATRLRIDEQRALLLAGTFSGSLDFGKGKLPGAAGGYVAKLSHDGGALFARSLVGNKLGVFDLASDRADGGGVWAAGFLSGTVSLTPDASIAASSGNDGLLLHYDPNGDIRTTPETMGTVGDQRLLSVNVLSDGRIIVFGDSNGGTSVSFCQGFLPVVGDDVIIGKCGGSSSAIMEHFGVVGVKQGARAAALDSAGNYFIAGDGQGNVDYNPGVVEAGAGGAFVVSRAPQGGGWARTFGPAPNQTILGLAVAPGGGVVAAGFFGQSIKLGGAHHDPDGAPAGEFEYKTTVVNRGFVVRLDANGNDVWSNVYGGPGDVVFDGVAVDPVSGDVALVGDAVGRVNFGGGDTTSSSGDLAVVVLDKDGNFRWSRRIGSGTDAGGFTPFFNQVAFDPLTHDVVAFATFGSRIDLGGGAGGLTAQGIGDAVLLRFSR